MIVVSKIGKGSEESIKKNLYCNNLFAEDIILLIICCLLIGNELTIVN